MTELPNVRKALEDYMNEVEKIYKGKLTKDGHKATGKLLNSIKVQVRLKDTTYIGEIRLQDYWKYIEYGTKPHWPPKNAILKWIQAKPIIPRSINGITPTNDQLAFLISRKISKFGTKAGGELGDTIDDVNRRYKTILEDALEKDVNDALAVIMTEFI